MIGLQLFLAMAATGVDYGWQYDDGGRLEYIIQIEPELLDALRDGQEIRSMIDPQLRDVRSFRIRVGRETPPRDPIAPESQRSDGGSRREDVTDHGYSSARIGQSDREQPNHEPRQPPPLLRRPNEGEPAPPTSDLAYPQQRRPDTAYDDLDMQNPHESPGATSLSIDDSASNGSAYDDQRSTMERYPWLADPNIGSRASDTDAEQPDSADPAHGRSLYNDDTAVDVPALGQPDFDHEPEMLEQVPPTEIRNITAAHESEVGERRTEGGGQRAESGGDAEDPSPADTQDSERQETIRPLMGQSTVSLALFASLGGNAYLGWICYGIYGRYRRLAAEIAQQSNGEQNDDPLTSDL